MTMELIDNLEHLKQMDSNPYCASGFVTDSSDIYTVEDYLEHFEMYSNGQNFYYSTHWEGEELITHDGKRIPSAYGE